MDPSRFPAGDDPMINREFWDSMQRMRSLMSKTMKLADERSRRELANLVDQIDDYLASIDRRNQETRRQQEAHLERQRIRESITNKFLQFIQFLRDKAGQEPDIAHEEWITNFIDILAQLHHLLVIAAKGGSTSCTKGDICDLLGAIRSILVELPDAGLGDAPVHLASLLQRLTVLLGRTAPVTAWMEQRPVTIGLGVSSAGGAAFLWQLRHDAQQQEHNRKSADQVARIQHDTAIEQRETAKLQLATEKLRARGWFS
jgi:hypothetical protein